MCQTHGPTKQLQLPIDGRVRLLLLTALSNVGLDRSEVDVQRPPVAEVISHGLDVGQGGAEGLDPTHPVVRDDIVQERTKLELPVLGSRELLEPLTVRGQLVELPADGIARGRLQVGGRVTDSTERPMAHGCTLSASIRRLRSYEPRLTGGGAA